LLALREEHKLHVFENEICGNIFKLEEDEVRS
jgi:hypothetical protein